MQTLLRTYLISLLFVCISSNARILHVPTEYTTIQSAINVSNNGDTILVQPMVYYERLSIINKQVTLSSLHLFSNDSSQCDSTMIILPDSIVNGGTLNRSVLYIRHSTVTIRGLTFKNGYGKPILISQGTHRIMGGGICVDSSIVQIQWCRFKNCHANGGGVGSFNSTVEISDCRIDSCFAISPLNSLGGGLHSLGSDSIKIMNTVFSNNHASFMGGGIYSSDFNGVLINCEFFDNYCTTGEGGGAVLISRGLLGGFTTVADNRFYNNVAGGSAGLLLQSSPDTSILWSLKKNIFVNNRIFDSEGGGATIIGWNRLSWEITDNLFYNNGNIYTSSLNGGALVIQSGIVNIRRNLFVENAARVGSAISIRNGVTAIVDSNYFSSNQGESVLRFSTSNLNATSNDFIQNQGVTVQGLSSTATAINNYWGHPSGPRTASNPGGQGDALPDRIPYIPFRTTPVFPELDVKDYGSERGQNGSGLPNAVTIEKVYPNPTNSTLTVNYTINRPQLVSIRLYDTHGREVYTSLPQPQMAGSHSFSLQTDGIASGLYFLKLSSPTSPSESAMQKVVLLK